MFFKKGLAVMTIAVSVSEAGVSAKPSPHTAQIETIVESVGTLADTRNFASLEALFADEVLMDYSSLSGEPAAIKSAQTVMTEWASILPGFDRTRHAISNIQTTINGSDAIATADVKAGHWIDDAYWQVTGQYAYRFEYDVDTWVITSMTFHLEGEVGSRDVFGHAMEAAQAHPADYRVRQQAKRAVLDFLTGLEDKDMDRVNGVWAEDAVQDMPYAPDGFPSKVIGKHAIISLYKDWPKNAGVADFTSELIFYPTLDPQTILVEYHGVSEILLTGRTYDQRYIGLFNVVDGKISLFREYFDPGVFSYAFGLTTPQ